MKVGIVNRPQHPEGVILLEPENNTEMAGLQAFMEDGIFVKLKMRCKLTDSKQSIFYEFYYDRNIKAE